MFSSIGYAFYSWHTNNLEWYAIERRQGEMEVDYDRWSSSMGEWKTAIDVKDDVVRDIERKKNFGPTDPLTEDEKKKIRENMEALAKTEGITVADPENIIRMQDTMRDMFREMPTIEQMEELSSKSDRSIEHFMSQAKDITDLGEKIDKLEREIANSKAKLNYQVRVTWAYIVGSVIAAVFGLGISRQGFTEWSAAERASRAEERKRAGRKLGRHNLER